MTTRRGSAFAGCTVALVTPFRDGKVDFDAYGAQIDWHLAQGTPVLSPVGTTGESPTLNHQEHEQIIAFAVERVSGRAKVMAGTGSNATSEAIRLTQFAKRAGADSCLSVAPYYNRPTQEGLYRHYAAIADACDLPMVLYNVPGRTGRNLEPATVERLARYPSIVAVKEAAGSLDQVSEILLRTELTVLSGDDTLTLPMLAVGAQGVVSVVGNLVPKEVIRLVESYARGDRDAALQAHYRLFPLCRDLLSAAPNPIPVKTALALLGRGNGEMRLPLCAPDESTVALLRRTLVEYGLIKSESK